MNTYRVKAVSNKTGAVVVETLDAENEVRLVQLLDFMGLTPLDIKKVSPLERLITFPLKLFKAKVKRKDLIELYENLHLVVRSGLPLGEGIWELSEDTDKESLKVMLKAIAFSVQTGESLSEAVKKYKKVFGDISVNLIAIGEETGNLDKVFKDLSNYFSRIEDFYSKTKQALMYPAFATTSVVIAMLFWLVYVMPKVMEVFKTLNVELPTLTLYFLAFSNFVKKNFIWIILSILGAISTFFLLRKKSKTFKYYTDFLLLKIPIISSILSNFYYAFFSEYMKLMLGAGITLYDSLEGVKRAIGNSVIREAIEKIKEGIERGDGLGVSMRETKRFPSLMVRMVSVGEDTGNLEEQFQYLSEHYYAKLDYITQNIAKMIEPIVLGFVGLFMALILLSFLAPVYDLITKIK